jgi:hypothetical protein
MTSATCYHARVRWVAFLLLALGVAHAAPQVEIRARSQLALTRVKLRDATSVEVRGQLVDKLTGDGLVGQRVYVTVGGVTREAFTQADGSFELVVPADPGPQQVRLSFAGGGPHDRADDLTVTTDPAKSQVELSIGKLGDDPRGATLRVSATGDGGAVRVPVTLAVAPPEGEPFEDLRTVETGSEIMIARRDVGGAGTYRLRARFAGDATRQPATATVTLELASNSTTTMHVGRSKLAFEDELVVTGQVTDDDDQPVARAAVTLVTGDRRLAQTATDATGRYRFEVEAELFGTGAYGIQVLAEPASPYVRSSRSQPAIVEIAAPQPVPVSYTVAAFLAAMLAAGGFFAARIRPWQRLRRPAPPADVPSEEGEIESFRGGLVVAKPGIVSTLRGAKDDGFAGVVRDTVRGRPIPAAVVRLVIGDREAVTRTGADGSFALDKLVAGEWRAEVAAPGHLTERFAVTIPHRGELRGVRIDLVPVRERVFQIYRRAAEPVLPEPRLWGVWSPRQIVDHVRRKRPSPALAELTDFVEEVYFSPRLAAESTVDQAHQWVDRAIQERARRSPARG